MSKNNKNGRYINNRTYIYYGLFIIALILIVWYIASWCTIKKQERLMKSYLVTSNTISYKVDDINDFSQVMQELPSEYFVYISYTNNEKIYKLEKKLKNIIDSYELNDEIYYIDVTDDIDDENLYNIISQTFNIDISNLPCIIYVRNGNIERIINEEKESFNYTDFEKLLKEFQYEKKSL